MTTTQKFKTYFNWTMRDKDPDLQARNFHFFWVMIRTALALVLITIPVIVYTYILYQNSNVDYYINYRYQDHPIWFYLDLPNGASIIPLLWVGYFFLFFTFILIFFFRPFVSGKTTKFWRFGAIALIAIVALIAVLFFALSQYKYSQFQDFFYYEAFTTGDGYNIKQLWARDIAKFFRFNYQNDIDSYNWEGTAVVWWVLICQVMIIFALIVGLQNVVFRGSLTEEQHFVAHLENTNRLIISDRFSRKINNLFKNTERNVSIFMSIIAILVIIPNLIYSILSTTTGTNLNALVVWSYKLPMFLGDNLDQTPFNHIKGIKSSYYGTLFVIGSLPLIILGLTISTLFFFLAALLRGENISSNIFILETGILFIYLLVLISTMFVAKNYMNRLTNFWNDPVEGTTRAVTFFNDLKITMNNDEDFNQLIKHFKNADLTNPNGFKIEWLSGPAMIGEAIVSYSFVFGTFIILGYDILKLTASDKDRVNFQKWWRKLWK